MDTKTLIQLLNFSKTLIQNGEVKFLFYDQIFMPPEEVGVAHSEVLEDLERQLRENPPKDDDPEALRKEILKQIELEKKYGALEDSNEWFQFIECNLAFHMKYTYRLEIISRFENFPSLGSLRFYGGDGQFCRYSNSAKRLERVFPGHLDNDVIVGSFAEYELDDPIKAYMYEVSLATNLPPPGVSIDETNSKVHLTKNSAGMPVYIITQFYKGKISYKFYVRINDGLPEVYKEEYYEIDDPSHPEGKQNYLSYVKLYRNFERVEKLNITIPKVVEVKLLALDEVSIERHTIVVIKERSLNLEFPTNFFDWDQSDLTGNNDRNNKIHGDVEKEEPQDEQTEQKEQQMAQPEMIKIDGGTVDPFGTGETVTVSPFLIDEHLVTYQQYNQFIEDGGYKKKKYWSEEGRKFLKKYEFWVPSTHHEEHLKRNELPVTGVSWYEVEAYTNWRGARLPTAAEWTLACQGDTKQRYPWGDEFDFETIDYRARLAPYAVGSREKNVSPAGVYDLVGNVWQWCVDAYDGKDFRLDVEVTGTQPGPQKILRGGAWMSLRRHFESDYLYYDKPFHRLATYGFRCAKDAE